MRHSDRRAGGALVLVALAALLTACQPGGAASQPAGVQILMDQQFKGDNATYRVTVDRETYPPHYASLWHTHPGPGTLCIIQGTVRIEVRDEPPTTLKAGDCWSEPPGVPHRPVNDGSTAATAIFYLMAPVNEARTQPAPAPS